MIKIDSILKEYSVVIAESIEDIEVIRFDWEYIAREIYGFDTNVHIDHYLTVIKNSKQVKSPVVIIIKKKSKACGIIVGRIESSFFQFSLGYFTIIKKKALCFTISYSGVIIPDEEQLGEKIKNIILEYSKIKKVHYIFINNLVCQSPLMSAIESSGFPKILKTKDKKQNHWIMMIPDSIEEFYQRKSRKHKKNMIYYGNKLSNDHSGEIRVVKYNNKDQIDVMIKDAESIAQKTYQRGMDVGFKDTVLTGERMKLAAEKGWLRSYILYVQNRPVAFQMGFHFKNAYFVQGKGYDPAFSDYRVGTYLFQQILIDFCNDKTINRWDFGLGDADYKELYGTDKWEEQTCYIFAYRPVSFVLFVTAKISGGIRDVFEKVIQSSGYYQRFKKRWRDKLSSKKIDIQ